MTTFDLGSYSRTVTTRSPQAQTLFDQGLNWLYAFNHEEAALCFRAALRHDPDCAIAWWGIALASGPFYNMPWDVFSADEAHEATAICHDAARQASTLAHGSSKAEQALIAAIACRFPRSEPGTRQDCARWEDSYANAMRKVQAAFTDDLDIAALTAEALMTRTPWRLWDRTTGAPLAGSDTLEALSIVEHALALPNGRVHPGLLHMHIHLLEMSPHPEDAMVSADALNGLCPDAGHLAHMPCHVYALCGQYQRAIDCSRRAILADDKYLAHAGANNFYTTARCHDLHMMMFAAMMAGQFQPAIDAANRMAQTLTPDLIGVKKPHMAITLEGYFSTRAHVLVRFGQWQAILNEPPPPCPDLYCVSTAMHFYTRGLAQAALGEIAKALRERALFQAALVRIPDDRLFFNNLAGDILAIALAMLDGEIAYRSGQFDNAFRHLRQAVRLNDTLHYNEPWAWMHPPRHALGALLLEQGRVAEAIGVYELDLGLDDSLYRSLHHPDNVWALHGYTECLDRLGRDCEARLAGQRLQTALAGADTPITASCACRGIPVADPASIDISGHLPHTPPQL